MLKLVFTATRFFKTLAIFAFTATLLIGCGGDEEIQPQETLTTESVPPDQSGTVVGTSAKKHLLVFNDQNVFVVDVSNPAKPQTLSKTPIDSVDPGSVFVLGNLLYTSRGSFIVANGVLKRVGNSLNGLFAIENNRGYAANGVMVAISEKMDDPAAIVEGNISVFNISDIVGEKIFVFVPLVVKRSILYGIVSGREPPFGQVAAPQGPQNIGDSSIVAIDFTDMKSPKLVSLTEHFGRIDPSSVPDWGPILARDDVLYIPARNGLSQSVAVDISNPKSPVVVAKLEDLNKNNALFVDGDHLYATAGRDGFVIYSLHDPTRPFMVSRVEGPQPVQDTKQLFARAVTASGNYAYVGVSRFREVGWSAVAVVNVADKNAPTYITTLELALEGYVTRLALME